MTGCVVVPVCGVVCVLGNPRQGGGKWRCIIVATSLVQMQQLKLGWERIRAI